MLPVFVRCCPRDAFRALSTLAVDSQGHRHVGSFLPMKGSKRSDRDVLDFSTHAGLGHDVTDRLLVTKWQHSRSCF